MKRHNEDQWLDALLSEHLQHEPAVFDPEQWAELYLQRKQTESPGLEVPTQPPKLSIPIDWRKIMKSPLTHVTAVLVVVFVGKSYLFPSPHGFIPESVALGEVLEAIQTQESLFARGHYIITFDKEPTFKPPGHEALFQEMLKEEENGNVTARGTSEYYLSPQGYANLVYAEDGTLIFNIALDNETGTVSVLFPTAKSYIRHKAPQGLRNALSQFTINSFIKLIYQSENHRALGTQHKQGVEAQGFEATDLQNQLFEGFNAAIVAFVLNAQQIRSTAWIDTETKLPVEIEGEGDVDACVMTLFEKAHFTCVVDSFAWGIDIDGDTFLPDIPADYNQIDPMGSAKQAAWIGVLPCGLLGYGIWHRRRKRTVINNVD